MSDAPVTRRAVPRPRWNDYQAVQRASVNHPSSILQNAPSVSQTASQPISQSGRQKGSYRQLTKNTQLGPNWYSNGKKIHLQANLFVPIRSHYLACDQSCWAVIFGHLGSTEFVFSVLAADMHMIRVEWGGLWIYMHNHIWRHQGSALPETEQLQHIRSQWFMPNESKTLSSCPHALINFTCLCMP